MYHDCKNFAGSVTEKILPAPGGIFAGHGSAVTFCDRLYNGQSQTTAGGRTGRSGGGDGVGAVKHPLEVLRRNAGPLIGHGDPERSKVSGRRGRQSDFRSGGSIFCGIAEQIVQNPYQFSGGSAKRVAWRSCDTDKQRR